MFDGEKYWYWSSNWCPLSGNMLKSKARVENWSLLWWRWRVLPNPMVRGLAPEWSPSNSRMKRRVVASLVLFIVWTGHVDPGAAESDPTHLGVLHLLRVIPETLVTHEHSHPPSLPLTLLHVLHPIPHILLNPINRDSCYIFSSRVQSWSQLSYSNNWTLYYFLIFFQVICSLS